MIASDTVWRDAGLLFGRMFEDWSLEARVFPPGARVFCIASAGCTALALAARGHDVTAVDVNPAQVALVRARIAGRESRQGSVDRMLSRGRRVQRLLGWSEPTLRRFLALEDPVEQQAFWRTRLDTWRWRSLLAGLLNPVTLRLLYPAPLAAAVPRGFAAILRRRLDRGFSTHANCTNPYASWLLLGEWPEAPQPHLVGTVTVIEADAASYLESCPARSFGALTLSNIGDAGGSAYEARLHAAVDRAAVPGAVAVFRSFAEPVTADEAEWARRDRALLWGRIRVLDV